MLFKKINAWLHLWLGLVSGIIVVILSVTGCILVFEQEIKSLLHPWVSIEAQDSSKVMAPSRIHEKVTAALPGVDIHSIWYHGLSKAANVEVTGDSLVYVNPYTGDVIKVTKRERFFKFIDAGHRNLWMGRKIGKPVVGWATFIFFFLLISGIILWFPKNLSKSNFNKSFKIKWKAKFKRVNYDLHNVLGFYSLIFALIMAVTGLVMSFSWFSKSVFWLSGGQVVERKKPAELAPYPQNAIHLRVDEIWNKVRKEIAVYNKEDIIIHFPDEPQEAIYACTDMINGNWRDLYFDPNNMSILPYSRKQVDDREFAAWLRSANYGLHVGAIGGLTTKILYFLASLICASLPVTGFIIWLKKGKKKPKKKLPVSPRDKENQVVIKQQIENQLINS